MFRMTWKVYACPKRMHSLEMNGEGEWGGGGRWQLANPNLYRKWPLKRSVCVVRLIFVAILKQSQHPCL